MLGNDGKRFVGIDSFGFRDASLEKVEANLERFGLPRPELVVGDVFELVPQGALGDTRIGSGTTTRPTTTTRRSRGCGSPSRSSSRARS